MHEHNKGILLLILTTFIFAIQDSVTKLLAGQLPVIQFLGIRYLVFFLFALWWTTRKRPLKQVLVVKHHSLQLLRGVLLGLESLLFAWTLKHLGIAQMYSIFVSFPLIVTALSPLILKEPVGFWRWIIITIGFIGAIIIIAPGSINFTIYSLFALGCAALYALYNILTRFVSKTDHTDSSLLYTGLMAAAINAPFLPFVWKPLTGYTAFLILLLCALGLLSHYLMIVALKLTPAVILQPFNYFTLPWALLLGVLLFGETIPLQQLSGAALVVASGLVVAYYQTQNKYTKLS